MAILQCYIDNRDLAALRAASLETGRGIEELAESAISEAACNWRREHSSDNGEVDRARADLELKTGFREEDFA